ncbi:hypothetical protein DCAR_0207288 [Daucus carota subsp. sativus]|uniref:Uncharacterized protein n=1 Tax=Daucus carota subsp. sativus TaxID=79200 RepID=A0A161Y7Z6_DAUCS|nr:PREDICTED: Golgi to ER traffic protein 4 homolog [Daucus carota subsp. sativus]WOG88055.1 hypothetical protein DCAR_0207288 [Daucus carota subsp. sativus]
MSRARRATLPPAQENIDKLDNIVKQGNSYGAQQMYKSITARYVAAERYSDALEIYQAGACVQLEHEQVTCGAELAVLLVETLVKGKFPYGEDTLERIRRIYEKFPRIPVTHNLDMSDDDMQRVHEALGAAKTRVECCSSFLKAAIRWSTEFGAQRNGSPEIHDMLAEYIYSESPEVDMAKVSFHFVRGKDLEKFASTLVNFTGKCYPGEDDMAIARAVLLYLSLGNLGDANDLVDEVQKQMQDKELDYPHSELIEFINYLLETLQRDALPLFNRLRQTYASSLDRDPALNELLDVVAEKFYGVRRRNPMQDMFGDIFKMMGGDVM